MQQKAETGKSFGQGASFWTAADVCAQLNISRRTLDALLKRGIPRIRLSRRLMRFDPMTTMNWIRNH